MLVDDATKDIFNIFLDIIYNVSINLNELSPRLIVKLFYLAEKYRIESIKIAIVDYLKAKVSKKDEVLRPIYQSIYLSIFDYLMKLF